MKKGKLKIVDISKEPDGATLISMAVEDGTLIGIDPSPGSILMPCTRCKRDCWVGPASQQDLIYIAEISCVKCAQERGWLEGDDLEFRATEGVLQEMREKFGAKDP